MTPRGCRALGISGSAHRAGHGRFADCYALRTLEVEESIDLGTAPLWLRPGADTMWVTASGEEEVLRMDPETLEITDHLEVGDYASPFLEAFGDGWVGSLNHNAVYRVSLDG